MTAELAVETVEIIHIFCGLDLLEDLVVVERELPGNLPWLKLYQRYLALRQELADQVVGY